MKNIDNTGNLIAAFIIFSGLAFSAFLIYEIYTAQEAARNWAITNQEDAYKKVDVILDKQRLRGTNLSYIYTTYKSETGTGKSLKQIYKSQTGRFVELDLYVDGRKEKVILNNYRQLAEHEVKKFIEKDSVAYVKAFGEVDFF